MSSAKKGGRVPSYAERSAKGMRRIEVWLPMELAAKALAHRGGATKLIVRLLALALAVVLATGCGGRDPLVLTVTEPSMVAPVQQAVDEWLRVCGIMITLGPGGTTVDMTNLQVPTGKGGVTYTDNFGRPNWIHVLPSEIHDVTLLKHEIGHALGLEHTPEGSGDIMDPDAHDNRHVARADCERLSGI